MFVNTAKILITFLALSVLFTGCKGISSPETVAGNLIYDSYINDQPNKFAFSKTYSEKDGRAVVLSAFCDSKKQGSLPPIVFLITTLKKEEEWRVVKGPDVYSPDKKLPIESKSTPTKILYFSNNLLDKLPNSCNKYGQ